jgi:two-component system sensor histidine kinase SenX3
VTVTFACLGLVAGFVAGRLVARSGRSATSPPVVRDLAPPAYETVLDTLTTGVVVVDDDENVVWTNASADVMRVTRGTSLVPAPLGDLVRRARRATSPVVADVELPDARTVRAIGTRTRDRAHVALLLDDTTDAQRVEAVRRDFVANVSHELKTPVGAILLLTEAMQDAGDDPAAVRRFAERLRIESARLSRLVQELIDLSRLQGAEPMRVASVPVRSFVTEAVDRTRLAATAADISVVVEVPPDLAVRGDERQLATAVANLLDNAIAYSPSGTRVAVGARRRDDDVEVAVTDQGIGIAAADRERVFERFYRVDPARSRETGGTGLGLAIVKHIATNHGGRVDVWSVEGTGSTFTLTLPAAVKEGALT